MRYQQKARVDDVEVKYRHEEVWLTREGVFSIVENLDREHADYSPAQPTKFLLLMDSLKSQITPALKEHYGARNTQLAVILSGLTSVVQPFDVSINRAFKFRYQDLYWHRMLQIRLPRMLMEFQSHHLVP